MMRVELNTHVARPIEDVFARLTDFSDYSRWMPKLGIFLGCSQTSEGPLGEGTTYYDRGRMGTFRGEIVEFRAPTRVAFRESLKWLGVEVMEARLSSELVRTQTGTEVSHTAERQLFGVFRLMEPVVARVARGERKWTVEALNASLEQGRLQHSRPPG